MAGFEVTLHGRIWVTPEEGLFIGPGDLEAAVVRMYERSQISK